MISEYFEGMWRGMDGRKNLSQLTRQPMASAWKAANSHHRSMRPLIIGIQPIQNRLLQPLPESGSRYPMPPMLRYSLHFVFLSIFIGHYARFSGKRNFGGSSGSHTPHFESHFAYPPQLFCLEEYREIPATESRAMSFRCFAAWRLRRHADTAMPNAFPLKQNDAFCGLYEYFTSTGEFGLLKSNVDMVV